MKNYSEIQREILFIERNFLVNSWKVNNIHIWPVLRIRLFFYLEMGLDSKKELNFKKEIKKELEKPSFFGRLIFVVKGKINVLKLLIDYYLYLFFLPKRKYVFVAAEAHRVNYKNTRYNRFFDTLIDKYALESDSMYLEYGEVPIENQYNKNNIYKYNIVYNTFLLLSNYLKKDEIKVSLDGYEHFLEYLIEHNMEVFSVMHSKNTIENWAITKLYPKVVFFKKILNKIKPKKVMILCYYSEEIMALTTAANLLNIETIEMQHGPQTETHLAYGSWSVIPENGYDMLPRRYWCWDDFSVSVLNKLSLSNKLYSSKNIGNPWVDYWKMKNRTYSYSGFILFAFQPICSRVTIEDLLPKSLINFIKNESYVWFIRLHPRQMEQKSIIVSYLKENGVFNKINIDNATKDPLPLLLANAKLHFTLNSGTTLEATFFNLKTVLIDELGKSYYADLINKREAFYLSPSDLSFSVKLKKHIEEGIVYRDSINEPMSNNLFD